MITTSKGKRKVKPREVTTLALSFDHRFIDGSLASRFLADVAASLEDPRFLPDLKDG